MVITRIKALWPENNDFAIVRPDIGNQYIFIHFLTPAVVVLNEEKIKVSEGYCLLYKKFSRQEVYSGNCDLLHDWFHIEGDLDWIVKKYGFEFNKIYKVSNSNTITKIVKTMENEFDVKNNFYNDMLSIKFEELIISIVNGKKETINSVNINTKLKKDFYDLRSKINLTYYLDWNVDKMAEEVNLSSSRFYKIYKELFGISPKRYLQEIRIEHAKTLLVQKKYLISEIAEMTGYNNQYHFIRKFKQITGITPGKYTE